MKQIAKPGFSLHPYDNCILPLVEYAMITCILPLLNTADVNIIFSFFHPLQYDQYTIAPCLALEAP